MRFATLLCLFVLFAVSATAMATTMTPPQPQGNYDTSDYYLSSDGTKKLVFSESDDGQWSVEYWELQGNGQWYLVGVYYLEAPDGPWDTDDTWTGLSGTTPMGINTTGGPDAVQAHDFHGNDLGTFNRSL